MSANRPGAHTSGGAAARVGKSPDIGIPAPAAEADVGKRPDPASVATPGADSTGQPNQRPGISAAGDDAIAARSYRIEVLATIVAFGSLVIAGLSAYVAYKSLEASERAAEASELSAKASELLVRQSIDDRVFSIVADPEWNVTISQVAGPAYQIGTVTLAPTFQLKTGRPVTKKAISIDLQSHRTAWPPEYKLPRVEDRMCDYYQELDGTSLCDSAALLSLDVTYTVVDQQRSVTLRKG
jgi:hypothetical protein